MPRANASLLAGRNHAPLTDQERIRVSNTCIGLERNIPFRVASDERTRFRVWDDAGEEQAEIVFGADVYPGTGVVDPNSSLSMQAAVAHEVAHYFRWRDKTEIPDDRLEHIDEALTSLEAILRYYGHLSDNERQQLVRDSIQRLQTFVQENLRE
jgi:hypothetical protein